MKLNCKTCNILFNFVCKINYCSKECSVLGIKRNHTIKCNIYIKNCKVCSQVFVSPYHSNDYCDYKCREIRMTAQKIATRNKYKEEAKIRQKRYYAINFEKIKITRMKYTALNKDKAKIRTERFSKLNPEINSYYSSNRRVSRNNAKLPSLYLRNDIKLIYKKRKELDENTGIKHNVDHIIPLKNDLICGLHVPWNLQIISFIDNMIKSNKFDGTYDNESWKKDKNTYLKYNTHQKTV